MLNNKINRKNTKAKSVNLFCLPFAGGNKYSYREYEEQTPTSLNIITLEYPGRGARIRENCLQNIHNLVDDVYQQIVESLEKCDYALYGHSLGGLLAYLLAKKIVINNHPPPLHLFITGTTAPASLARAEEEYHLLDKKEFINKIKALQGIPDEILNNEELINFFEPILRADFTASETYVYEEYKPLPIPITVTTGTQEDIQGEDIKLWQLESQYVVDFNKIEGGHFFIFKNANSIIQIILKKLTTLIN